MWFDDDEYIELAKEICSKCKEDITFWEQIAELYNHISISYQNVFDFESSINNIQPYVEFFEAQSKSPFGGNVRSRFIGALYGNYSQSLFFLAHLSFFKNKSLNYIQELIDEGILYSKESESHFTEIKDIERQLVYRLHAYLQGYILLKEEQYMNSFKDELNFEINEKVINLTNNINNISENELYMLSVLLKFLWLKGEKSFLKKEKIKFSLSPTHPNEQILGYYALLGNNKAKNILLSTNWGENIVDLIATMFLVQISWENNECINKKYLEKIDYYQYQFKILDNINFKKRLLSIINKNSELQPLFLLPYNYA